MLYLSLFHNFSFISSFSMFHPFLSVNLYFSWTLKWLGIFGFLFYFLTKLHTNVPKVAEIDLESTDWLLPMANPNLFNPIVGWTWTRTVTNRMAKYDELRFSPLFKEIQIDLENFVSSFSKVFFLSHRACKDSRIAFHLYSLSPGARRFPGLGHKKLQSQSRFLIFSRKPLQMAQR